MSRADRNPAREEEPTMSRAILKCFILGLMLLVASPAMAVDPVAIDSDASNVNSGDTAWMLTSAGLVLMMTGPGLALFCSGLVRRKNVLATTKKRFILCPFISLVRAFIVF